MRPIFSSPFGARALARPDKAAKEALLYSFGSSGVVPFGGLIADSSGALYGMTHGGGGSGCGGGGCGTIFKLTPSGSTYVETTLYSFTGRSDGATPLFGSLLASSSGVLYGLTNYGGTSTNCSGPSQPAGCGVAFSLAPAGKGYKYTVLHSFASGSDGAYPLSSLIADASGALYGMTSQGGSGPQSNCPASGGSAGCGTIFKLTPSGKTFKESVIYTFQGGVDGALPDGALVADSNGTLYGTTELGGGGPCTISGIPGCGTVFALTPSGKSYTESVIHSFTNAPDGAFPYDTLALNAKTGALYGTTINGGTNVCSGYGCGIVFSLTPGGNGYTEKIMYDFDSTHGALPVAGLTVKGTLLYGATIYGGNTSCSFSNIPGCGVIFSIKETGGGFKVVYEMQGQPNDGAGIYGTPYLGPGGALFGTTYLGGANNVGSVYELMP